MTDEDMGGASRVRSNDIHYLLCAATGNQDMEKWVSERHISSDVHDVGDRIEPVDNVRSAEASAAYYDRVFHIRYDKQ